MALLKGNSKTELRRARPSPWDSILIFPKICLSHELSSHGLNITIQYCAGPIWRRGRQRLQKVCAGIFTAGRVLQELASFRLGEQARSQDGNSATSPCSVVELEKARSRPLDVFSVIKRSHPRGSGTRKITVMQKAQSNRWTLLTPINV
jgi:hypothetical protein